MPNNWLRSTSMLYPLLPDSVMEHGPIMRRPTPHNKNLCMSNDKCMSNDSPEVSIFPKRTHGTVISISVQYIANVECRPTLIIVMHVIRLRVERHSHAQRKKQGAQQTPTRARQNKPFEDPNKEASKTKHAVLLQAGHGSCKPAEGLHSACPPPPGTD